MEKKLLTLVMLTVAWGYSSLAYDFSAECSSGQTLYYDITSTSNVEVVAPGNTSTITPWAGYIEPTGVLVIPSTVNYSGHTYSVTSIGYAAFQSCGEITSVTIPNSIKHIGSWAFYCCTSLATINYPTSSILVDQWVFAGTAWFDSQPDGLVYLNNMLYCYKGINMPENYTLTVPSNVNSIAGRAFSPTYESGYSNLVNVSFSNSVEYIGMYAFYKCHLSNLSLPSSIIIIDNFAFGCNYFTTITIPASVTHIGDCAFKQNGLLTTVNYNATSTNDMTTFMSPFYDCQNLSTIHIGNNVRNIQDYLFQGCNRITGNLTLPNSLISIGEYAFEGCTGLTGSITIPNSTTTIHRGAFQGCTGITTLTIGTGVTTIETTAFYNMTNLSTINYNATNCSNTEQFVSIFQGNSIQSINIGNNVHVIADGLVQNCPNLTTITIPSSVTRIGTSNFISCGLSGTLTIPSNVQYIGYGAFNMCVAINKIECHRTTPPTIESYNNMTIAFNNGNLNIPIFVPCESISAYQSAPGWSHFTNITCVGDAIDENESDNIQIQVINKEIIVKGLDKQSFSVFSIDGRMIKNINMSNEQSRVEVPVAGVYIVRIDNNTVKKVVVQ